VASIAVLRFNNSSHGDFSFNSFHLGEKSSMPIDDWKIAARHLGTSRMALQRTENFEHTGNNEGTMTDSIKVLDSDLNTIFSTLMTIDWEYHGTINVSFSDDGNEIRIKGSDGQYETHRLS
jgi:hypothetical protein